MWEVRKGRVGGGGDCVCWYRSSEEAHSKVTKHNNKSTQLAGFHGDC